MNSVNDFQTTKEVKKFVEVLEFSYVEFLDLNLFVDRMSVLKDGYKHSVLVRVSYITYKYDNVKKKIILKVMVEKV